MIKNVTSNIEKMVNQAAQLANQHFPNSSEKETSLFNSETRPANDQYDQIKVELADGQLANVTLPPELRD